MKRFFSWHRIALSLAVTALLSLQVHAQTKEQIKPDRIGYPWADKYSDEIYMLDVDVTKSTKEIKDAQVYLGEMVADPATGGATVGVIEICLIGVSFRSPLYKLISRCFLKSSDSICFRSFAIPSTPFVCV